MSNWKLGNEDLISIIVPIYNVEDYVERCIDSIVNQSYYNLEIILVDDGSTDNSGKICDRKALKDSRIQVVHKQNEGLLFARKTGVLKATGKYIGFVDGDDYVDSEMYKELWMCMKQNDVDMVHSGFIQEQGKKQIYCFGFEEGKTDIGENSSYFLENYVFGNNQQHMSFSIWSKMFKADLLRRCIKKIEKNINYGEDLILLCIYIMESKTIFWKKSALYHYISRQQSLTNQSPFKIIQDESILSEKLIELFKMYNCDEIMEKAVNAHYKERIQNVFFQHYMKFGEDAWIQKFLYPEIEELWDKRIVLYGAGEVGKNYYIQINKYEQCNIVAWVDSFPEKYAYRHKKVKDLKGIQSIDYDVIVIAVQSKKMANEIKDILCQQNIAVEKIIWKEPRYLWEEI